MTLGLRHKPLRVKVIKINNEDENSNCHTYSALFTMAIKPCVSSLNEAQHQAVKRCETLLKRVLALAPVPKLFVLIKHISLVLFVVVVFILFLFAYKFIVPYS